MKQFWQGVTAVRATAVAVLISAAAAKAAEPTPAELDFFEKKIRPVLNDKCYSCHSVSEGKSKGGLVVDSKEALLKGGDTGPSIVPGDPDKSLFIKAIRYTDPDLRMPPSNKKLSTQEIADLEQWVKMGAPDPRKGGDPDKWKEQLAAAEKDHWAFKPVAKTPVPEVKMKGWVGTPVDNFILQQLESKAMFPSFGADRRTLIRRATYDLVGLPPTAAEVKAFVEDKSPDAYEKLIDRLLASPQYGERWGRYWLDIARYADTKGDVNNNREDFRFPYAWTYRDYVIKSFNDDKPYDKFIMEQLAGDKMVQGEDKQAMAGLGFLTLGKRFAGNRNEIIDDQIDAVSKGLLGLTVSCSRCHDHKFDPIPTADYYSWHGIFNSTTEPEIEPLLSKPVETPEFLDFQKQLEKLQAEVRTYKESNEVFILTNLRTNVAKYLYVAYEAPKMTNAQARNEFILRTNRLNQGVLGAWQRTLAAFSRQKQPSIFTPLIEFSKLKPEEYATKGRALSAQFAQNQWKAGQINPYIARLFAGSGPVDFKDVTDRYGRALADVDKKWEAEIDMWETRKKLSKKDDLPEPTRLSDKYAEEVRMALYGQNSPANPPSNQIDNMLPQQVQQRQTTMRGNIAQLKMTHPGSPPRAQSLEDSRQPRDSRVFIRGNASSLGDPAPRQFLKVLSTGNRQPFSDGSGRYDLAKAIASKENPLTARVMVNRIWMYHFGEALVPTTSDFGTRSTPPSHPELLDYLSNYFMDNGWSVKKMHKLMMLSSTYQQASTHNPRYSQMDPGNKLLWRMNIRRLDFESLRDTLLALGGKLDTSVGGNPVDITKPETTRRTVYGYVDRRNLPEVFNHFDFANPDLTTSKRYFTIVPQQSLFLMNNPMVVQQARNLVERPDFKDQGDEEKRVKMLYDLVLQREPSQDEVKMGLRFLDSLPGVTDMPAEQTWKYGYGEVDEASKRVKEFRTLNFLNNVWKAGNAMPDKNLGYLSLSKQGGHPGKNPKQAAVRRWTAPRDAIVTINGTLDHPGTTGDGVRARVISSRSGEVGGWTSFKQKVATKIARIEVKAGDTLDFVVDPRANDGGDSFNWAPVITVAQETGETIAGLHREWNADKDFTGNNRATVKALSAWEKYAHVLLLSNEVTFIN
ncbi:MAG TPA: PSD1 and planctomycete cytochrome C domain-containing protein [Verrucomicrobiae bacterium]